jgi:hypothetical protein
VKHFSKRCAVWIKTIKAGGALWTLLLVLFFGACRRETATPANQPRLAVEGAHCARARNNRFWVSGTVRNVGNVPLDDLGIRFDPEPPFLTGQFSTYFPPVLGPNQSLSFSLSGQGTNTSQSMGNYIGRGKLGIDSKRYNMYLELPCWSDDTINVIESPLPTECAGRAQNLFVTLFFKTLINGQWVDRPMPEGTCYKIANWRISRWLSTTEALIGRDDRFVLIEFASPPKSRTGVNASVAIKAGTFPYKNEFGASYPIPRLKLLANIISFEEPAKAATDSSPIH